MIRSDLWTRQENQPLKIYIAQAPLSPIMTGPDLNQEQGFPVYLPILPLTAIIKKTCKMRN